MTCSQRGHFTFGPTDLETGDPTGLFADQVRVPEGRQLDRVPKAGLDPEVLLESIVPFGSRKAPPPTLEFWRSSRASAITAPATDGAG